MALSLRAERDRARDAVEILNSERCGSLGQCGALIWGNIWTYFHLPPASMAAKQRVELVL
jgi:hypothetical protein